MSQQPDRMVTRRKGSLGQGLRDRDALYSKDFYQLGMDVRRARESIKAATQSFQAEQGDTDRAARLAVLAHVCLPILCSDY